MSFKQPIIILLACVFSMCLESSLVFLKNFTLSITWLLVLLSQSFSLPHHLSFRPQVFILLMLSRSFFTIHPHYLSSVQKVKLNCISYIYVMYRYRIRIDISYNVRVEWNFVSVSYRYLKIKFSPKAIFSECFSLKLCIWSHLNFGSTNIKSEYICWNHLLTRYRYLLRSNMWKMNLQCIWQFHSNVPY